MNKLNIYIGYDSSNYGQEIAYEVCKRSILKYNSNLNIYKLVKKDLENKKIFKRNDNSGTTEFTYTRFLVPYLNNFEGFALFCDSDFLWQCDPTEILNENIEKKFNVGCVKHEYKDCKSKLKMNGLPQEWYPRKNWSSLMLFNCSKCKILTPEVINYETPKYLHRLEWCNDKNIISINKSYNYLVGYYNDLQIKNIKALHYTDGGPWHPGYENTEFSKNWLEYITLNEKDKLIKEIGVKL